MKNSLSCMTFALLLVSFSGAVMADTHETKPRCTAITGTVSVCTAAALNQSGDAQLAATRRFAQEMAVTSR